MPMNDRPDREQLQLLQLENAHLKDTICVLREELEKMQIRHETDLQGVLRAKEDELQQLRAAVEALREKLERNGLSHEDEKRQAEQRLRVEIVQLQTTIRVLRERLAEHGE
jgi:hypothetical protein